MMDSESIIMTHRSGAIRVRHRVSRIPGRRATDSALQHPRTHPHSGSLTKSRLAVTACRFMITLVGQGQRRTRSAVQARPCLEQLEPQTTSNKPVTGRGRGSCGCHGDVTLFHLEVD